MVWGLVLLLAHVLAPEASAQLGGIPLGTIKSPAVRNLLAVAQNTEQQDPVKAETALADAVKLAEQRELQDLPAALLWQAGFLQRQKRPDQALVAAKRALDLLMQTVGRDGLQTAVAHGALGSYERDAGNREAAEAHFQEVIDAAGRDPNVDRNGELWMAAWNLGMERQKQKRYAEAEILIKQALAIKRLYPFDPVWIPRLNEWLASVTARQSHFDDAVTYFETAVEMKLPNAKVDGDLSDLLLRQASLLQSLHMYDWAAISAGRAYLERRRLFGAEDAKTKQALETFSKIQELQREPAKAEQFFRSKLAAIEGGDQPVNEAWARAELARTLRRQKKLDEAYRLARRAVTLMEQVEPRNIHRYVERLQLRGALHADLGQLDEAIADYRRALDESVAAFGAESERAGNAQMLLAVVLKDSDRVQEAEAAYLAALAIRTRVGELLPLSVTQVHLASLYRQLGRYDEAEKLARDGLRNREARLAPNDTLIADALFNLGLVYRDQERLADAEPPLRRALEIRRAVYGPADITVADTMNALASVLDGIGHTVDAEPMLRMVLSTREELVGAESIEVAETLGLLASALRRQGKLDEAAELTGRVTAIHRKLFGAENTLVASNLVTLARIDQARSEFDKAEQSLREALAIRLKAFGETHVMIASTYLDLGALSAARRQFEEAGGYAAKALRIVEAKYPADDPKALPLLAEYANVLSLSRDLDGAEERLKRILDLTERTHGSESVEVAVASEAMAYLNRLRGRFGNLDRLYERPLATYRTVLGPQHPTVARALSMLADYRVSVGEAEEAMALYDEALAILTASYGADAPALWSLLNNKALLLKQMKREEEAKQLFEQSIALVRKSSRRETADLAVAITNYAWFCEETGRRHQADELSAEALRISRNLYGEERAPPAMPAAVLPPRAKEI